MSYQSFIVTVSNLYTGSAQCWVAGSQEEMVEMLETSLGYDGRRPSEKERSLMAANAMAVFDILAEEDSLESLEAIWGTCHDLGEFDGCHFLVSFVLND